MPQLEIDERFFEIIATSETAVMTKHRLTGNLGLWRLEWRDRGNFPPGFEGNAWAAYLAITSAANQAVNNKSEK